ncbi:phosphoribosyltransferase domain-containing protein [Thiothrix subterranea]|uniref:Phosphoribosyltransferase domain-containing protein n=1 Tax=Thiothrix subterranea TaxID=2735563 RepID=A0AA51MKT9_9GAMM|nr:phosphoribosyltransferase domain-containing protein [Thiothrix subterranea]MDQ5769653.1 phosphoribosyltransferase domain-containing protein [Thiothrix subterranea]WML85725.1 phosphoribosyltransferase domain-containing protein [Thiothrix subterranea]
MQINVALEQGTLNLTIESGTHSPDELFGFAQRRNPKRAFLFVSKVLGRHIPVSPAVMRNATDTLAAQIPADLPGPVVVIGMAETAIAMGAGVQQALSRSRDDTLYLCTTRHPLDLPILVEFREEHSHATQQVLHLPQHAADVELLRTARTLVLVDDEASTGKTFANLLEALQCAGLDQFEHIVAATLTDWSGGAAAERLGERAIAVSLLSGHWNWQANDAPPPEMPQVDVLGTGEWHANPANDWGRLGVREHPTPEKKPLPNPPLIREGSKKDTATTSCPSPDKGRLGGVSFFNNITPGERILVLGTGEFVWPPFLLAEHLEQQGATVHFSATTRSPIALGHSIQHRYCLHDNYGQGIANFLYNVVPENYDRILLCSEPPAHLLDKELINVLNPTCVEFYP